MDDLKLNLKRTTINLQEATQYGEEQKARGDGLQVNKDDLEAMLTSEKAGRLEQVDKLSAEVERLTVNLDSQIEERIKMKQEFDTQMLAAKKERLNL